MMTRSPISRVGGKYYLAKKIIPLFPEHTRYVEPFGGAMHVLFRKEPSLTEVYNDIDSSLVNFFKVVKYQPEKLFKLLDFTLYSREVFFNALHHLDEGDDVERAASFYIVNRQCFGGKMKNWGVSLEKGNGFFDYEQRIREAHRRLQQVYIENLDWREVIKKYDTPGALFYLDPPYMFNGSRGDDKFYNHEMSDGDHAALVEVLKGIKGKFLLSGYTNGMYDCFERVPMGEVNMCVNKRVGGERVKKHEFIWKNF